MKKNLNQPSNNNSSSNKLPVKKVANPFGGGASLAEAKNSMMNMNAFYNNEDLFGPNPVVQNNTAQQKKTVVQPTQIKQTPVATHKKANSSQNGSNNFANALNSMQNMNAFYNNEELFGSNPTSNNNLDQNKLNVPQRNYNSISQPVSSSSSFSGTGVQIGGSIPQQSVQTIKNTNLFERVFVNEEKAKSIQKENNSLYTSQSKYFQKEHASLFSQDQTDLKQIYHWNSIFTSVQSEENLFFNFSKFQNEFDQVFYNLENGQKFTDQTFPNNEQVLNNKPGAYLFRRANEIYNNEFNIFDLTIEPNQIQQGQLGDCYLISSITALAEHPELCTRLLVSKDKNDKCVYGVWLCESGEWRQFVIDDYLVCSRNSGTPIFAKSIRNGIWVQLLEKAYAKCYGGYGKIEVGYSFDSLRDLTGSPTEYIDIKKNYGEAFTTIKQSLKNKYILTASSKMSAADLQSKHSYTIFDAREVLNSKGQQVKLLKIKNPLGYNFQMNQMQDEAIENQLGEPIRQSNGILWMTQQEVLANFEVFTVCHTHPGYVCGSYTTSNKTKEYYYVQNLTEGNHCYFSIFQKHEKFYKQGQNDQKNYYKTARLIVTQIDTEKQQIIDVVGGTFSNKQQAFFEVQNLPKGEFLVFVEIDGKSAPQNNQFTLQTYSKDIVSIAPAFNQIHLKVSESELIETIFKLYIKKINNLPEWNTKVYDNTKGIGTVIRDFSSLFGYAFISYRNDSVTQFTETIEVVEYTNLELFNFDKSQKQQQVKIVLEPNESKVLIYRILENNACSHSLKFKSTWFFGSGVVKVPINSGQKPTLVKQTVQKTITTPAKNITKVVNNKIVKK